MNLSAAVSLLTLFPTLVSILFVQQPDMCRVIPEAVEFCGVRVDFGIACGKHAFCYSTCGRSQGDCDSAFADRILDLCGETFNHTGTVKKSAETCYMRCAKTALLFHVSVRNFAKDYFKEAQKKANCTTTPTASRR